MGWNRIGHSWCSCPRHEVKRGKTINPKKKQKQPDKYNEPAAAKYGGTYRTAQTLRDSSTKTLRELILGRCHSK
jgi:hypothetical protein